MPIVLEKCKRGVFPDADEFKDYRDPLYLWAGNCKVAIAVRERQALDRINRRVQDILYTSERRVPS